MSIEKVLELYGIGKKKIEKHSESEERAVWTINDMYILKESKTKNAIDKNIKITNMLIQHKIPLLREQYQIVKQQSLVNY